MRLFRTLILLSQSFPGLSLFLSLLEECLKTEMNRYFQQGRCGKCFCEPAAGSSFISKSKAIKAHRLHSSLPSRLHRVCPHYCSRWGKLSGLAACLAWTEVPVRLKHILKLRKLFSSGRNTFAWRRKKLHKIVLQLWKRGSD